MKKTFREVIKINNGGDGKLTVSAGDGLTLSASCWTDDPEVLDWEATFSIISNWGEGFIGRFDNLHGELDSSLQELSNAIEKKCGGRWIYDAADCCFAQAD